ncbi:helix-turn-helix transcriptional regulator [Oscillatoriales cyanobacterium LEGE 11467]|uniref:Helix-turn-helix transcriptional regulator n=2 Tax=Zarconia TaxID=2992130 RepID=A0A928VW52_9CYAN|nr:helix-turn-helix transcriptional regulator [Zarconia navalis LEGE 11467]
MTALQPLFKAIQQSDDRSKMRSHLTPILLEYFEANRAGIFFFDRLKQVSPKLRRVLDIALCVDRNPLFGYMTERHTPVHEGMVTTPKAWKIICPRPDHWHVMAGPLIQGGRIVGSVGCTRDKTMPAFNSQDVTDLSAVCLHLSERTAVLRSTLPTSSEPSILASEQLTPRELEIANLVALGRTNAEIGRELWITENSVKQALKRMFRKLKVRSRTQMVTQISRTQSNS